MSWEEKKPVRWKWEEPIWERSVLMNNQAHSERPLVNSGTRVWEGEKDARWEGVGAPNLGKFGGWMIKISDPEVPEGSKNK